YTATNAVHASGFLAVYLGSVVLGNAALPHRRAVLGFAGSMALLAEAGLFLMLGLLSEPSRLPAALPTALLVGAVGTFVARPLAVVLSGLPFRLPWRQQAFVSWAGLRGAVPIVLALIPVTQGVAGATRVLDVVLVLVVVYTLVQAPTLPAVGRRLGVVGEVRTNDLEVEAAPLDELRADLLGMTVPAGSGLVCVHAHELRLPRGAHLTLVVRGDSSLVPDVHTRLAAGDGLLVVATAATREDAERRLRAVSRDGKLAGWQRATDQVRPGQRERLRARRGWWR
ncbi:MAG: cation:proton antiporter, partial [Mycobacteriales bacterium]